MERLEQSVGVIGVVRGETFASCFILYHYFEKNHFFLFIILNNIITAVCMNLFKKIFARYSCEILYELCWENVLLNIPLCPPTYNCIPLYCFKLRSRIKRSFPRTNGPSQRGVSGVKHRPVKQRGTSIHHANNFY